MGDVRDGYYQKAVYGLMCAAELQGSHLDHPDPNNTSCKIGYYLRKRSGGTARDRPYLLPSMLDRPGRQVPDLPSEESLDYTDVPAQVALFKARYRRKRAEEEIEWVVDREWHRWRQERRQKLARTLQQQERRAQVLMRQEQKRIQENEIEARKRRKQERIKRKWQREETRIRAECQLEVKPKSTRGYPEFFDDEPL